VALPLLVELKRRRVFRAMVGYGWLEKGVEEQDPLLPLTVKSNQTWDPVRSDPRFQKLLRRMNLE